MYDLIPFILGAAIIALGLFMICFPKKATRAEDRENEAAVARVKKGGIIEIICGIVIIGVGIWRLM